MHIPLAEVIQRSPLVLPPNTPIENAITAMSQHRTSCVLVMEQERLVGIFTERDVVRITAAGKRLEPLQLADLMTTQTIALIESDIDDIFAVSRLLRRHRIRHLPILDRQGQLLGLITPQSIRDALKPEHLLRFVRVGEIVTTNVICAEPATPILRLAELMAEHRISCVAIVEPSTSIPVGIVTERDIVQFQSLKLDFARIPAQEVMSTPLSTVKPQDSLWSVHDRMQQLRVRRLVVTGEGGELFGIITQTHMLQLLDPVEMYGTIETLQQAIDRQTVELQQEIVQRQELAIALADSEARYRSVVEDQIELICRLQPDGTLTFVNDSCCRFFGKLRQELIGSNLMDLLAPEHRDLWEREWQQLLQPHPDRILSEQRLVLASGEVRWVQWTTKAIVNPWGQMGEYQAVGRDITDRKQADEILRQHAERERLLADITQQIRRSLNLEEILQTTTVEVQQFLETDRVLVSRFEPSGCVRVVAESVRSAIPSLLGKALGNEALVTYWQNPASQHAHTVETVEVAELPQWYREFLQSLHVQAKLVVPIRQEEALWGLLVAHHCTTSRRWRSTDLSLMEQLAAQLAIAIQQAGLYEQLQQVNQELERLAAVDDLTQVANRRRFDELLNREWQRLARSKAPLSLILGDVDYFKRYNDTYGHRAGDMCLAQVAQALSGAARRATDLVARYGGEEFVMVLPNTDRAGAVRVAINLQAAIEALQIPHKASDVGDFVTMSLGIATTIPRTDRVPAELVEVADRALYQSKLRGRNRYSIG